MATYDPKRPRPAQSEDEPAPVEALLEPQADTPPVTTNGSADPARSPQRVPAPHVTEVPVAPAPEVGTTNRAVLYAALGVAGLLSALVVVLRLRSRRARSTD